MDKEDSRRFGQAMKALKEVFAPDMVPSALRTELYFRALEDLPIEAIEHAAMRIVKTREYSTFPKPGEIRAAAPQPAGTTALESWGRVMAALESGVEPEDPKIVEVIRRMGGWQWLQQKGYDELRWEERRFVAHYDEIGATQLLPADRQVALIAEKVGRLL